ncbi:ThiF family adenylyltransferase [Actinomycetota bacterium]
MSTGPLALDHDLGRVLDDGFDAVIQGGHLVIRNIPYVRSDRTVGYGFLAYPVAVSGDRVISETDHRIWFGGDAPCNENGTTLTCVNPEQRVITDELTAQFMLSSKPGPHGYLSQYEKVTAYSRIVSHPAQALDPTVTATPGAAWQEVEDDLPFRYRDTATTRAGLAGLTKMFLSERIAIVGVGGTGGYILDQVAKTPVASITMFDRDYFDNHNAFRAPGAASLEDLRRRPRKVEYFAEVYGRMHTGITPVPEHITEENLHLLDDSTFVFLAMDDATMKPAIIAHLTDRGIPHVDVGMGVEEIDGKLSGLLRTTYKDPGAADGPNSRANSIPGPAKERDDYSRNIQVSDLNALNAMLAVCRWKRHLGFYADGNAETVALYSIYLNNVTNEDDR